ncbi:hypothetical protein HGA92_00530 [Candidatus Gracilibacteria bacterium]|nr:hypothetical protein [Candidatus Gracilibacteria bacterium]NUJ98905.1 hypothetical protein [Candidatus Gracilibacteria bacterium]
MKVSELLKEFPEKNFSEVWKEKINSIRGIQLQISENEIKDFEERIKKVFTLDKELNELKKYLKNNEYLEISEIDSEIIKNNGIYLLDGIINLINNPKNIKINSVYIEGILENFYIELDKYYFRETFNSIINKKFLDANIEKLNSVIRLIKLENEKKENISSENLEKISDLLEKIKSIDEKFPEIEKKMESFLSFEKNITKDQIGKIGDFYTEQGKILNKTNYKNVLFFIKNKFEWKNTDWIILSIVTGVLIISFSIFNIYKKGETILSTLPSIATLSVFLIFFLKQYSNNRNLINSYNFKGTSANIMEQLLTTRKKTEEGKLILEKTLDKILEDPVIHQKGGNDTINLVNTSLKTPGS